MDNDMNSNSARVRVYHPQGYQVYIEFSYVDAVAAMHEVDAIAAAGWLPSPADLPPGGEKEKMATIVKREKEDGTPIIDFYPEWNATGSFGEHRYAHMYLDTPEDVAQFEAQSGLKLASLPTYDKDRLKRTFGKTHKCEVTIVTPFDMVKIPDGQHASGMPKYQYQYAILKHVNAEAHWGDNADNKKALTDKMATLQLSWNYIREHVEDGRVLNKVSDTTLTFTEFMTRLDTIAVLLMAGNESAGEGGNSNGTDPLSQSMKKAS